MIFEEVATLVFIAVVVGAGGWLVFGLIRRAEREAQTRTTLEGDVGNVGVDEVDVDEAPDMLGVPSTERFADVLLTLPLVVPPADPSFSWLMNQGPLQFGLMPEPAVVAWLESQAEEVVQRCDDDSRKVLVESATEVLLRSIEWRKAEAIHHLLIYVLGELGDADTLPVLDELAEERAFDDDEKKALAGARRRIDTRLEARRGQLAVVTEGGELAFARDEE